MITEKYLKTKGFNILETWNEKGTYNNPDYHYHFMKIEHWEYGIYQVGYCIESTRNLLRWWDGTELMSSYKDYQIIEAITHYYLPDGFIKDLNEQFWTAVERLNLGIHDLYKITEISLPTTEMMADAYCLGKDFKTNKTTLTKMKKFINQARFVLRNPKTQREKEQLNKEMLEFMQDHQEFYLYGIKVRDMAFRDDIKAYLLGEGFCDVNLFRMTMAVQNPGYASKLEKSIVFTGNKRR